MVVPLFIKGDQRVSSNYRGITLLSLPGKVYSKVLERRVQLLFDTLFPQTLEPGEGKTIENITLVR